MRVGTIGIDCEVGTIGIERVSVVLIGRSGGVRNRSKSHARTSKIFLFVLFPLNLILHTKCQNRSRVFGSPIAFSPVLSS